ncbi:hypothetical protein CGCF413_v002948 [Colletotrichum fructicola]|nr:hypothetical protein CGCF413_v002948 [Colletotrichum fructicola]
MERKEREREVQVAGGQGQSTPTLVLIEAVILATYSPLAQHNRSRRPPLSALTTQPAACLLVFIAFPAL